MAASKFFPIGMKLPWSVLCMSEATSLFDVFGQRGDDPEKYNGEELYELSCNCQAILDELARIYPKHQEKDYFEYILRFATGARQKKFREFCEKQMKLPNFWDSEPEK